MQEFQLKYGCNPNQKPARIFMPTGELPLQILNGRPGYINFMDALNAWQLVKELKQALGLPAATSFKHVSPAGAALGLPLSPTLAQMYMVKDQDLSPLACAYARARGADRMSSFGDFIALSDSCDLATAKLIRHEVSDGIIAPGFEPEALALLKEKRGGNYNIIQIDAKYIPAEIEHKQIFGIMFEQGRNNINIDNSLLSNIVSANKNLPDSAKRDLLLALITLKYCQSNSVCYTLDGQTIGVGVGQQSRIHCTRLAGDKADIWHLRQHPLVLNLPFKADIATPNRDNAIDIYISRFSEDLLADGAWQQLFTSRPEPLTEAAKQAFLAEHAHDVCLGSDAFFPFTDNIERAHKSGVKYIVEPGGSIRDDLIIEACQKLDLVLIFNGVRLFHH